MLKQGDILIAEDSRLLLQLLKDALLAHGISEQVQACTNGLELLSRAEQAFADKKNPGLYILDIIMPGPSGLEVARRLRGLEVLHQVDPIPILFYSGMERNAVIDETIDLTWPARFIHKAEGRRPDALALAIVESLKTMRD